MNTCAIRRFGLALARLVCLGWLLGAGALGLWAKETVYFGEARDASGTLVYTESHRLAVDEGRTISSSLTEYRSVQGELIATMQSDYSKSVSLPTYVFEDLRHQHREGVRWQDGHYVIFRQEGNAPEKTSLLQNENEVYSCQGWHYYLVNNLDLLEKDNLTLNLVLPSELRPFPFTVKKVASDASHVSAELSLKHWLFRFFAPKLLLEYDKRERRLLQFHGISNILTKGGERQVVTLRYTYPAQTETAVPRL